MKKSSTLRQSSGTQDHTLRWTMRVVGLVLAISSIVFINQDIFTSGLSFWFFGLSTGLGVITMAMSWMPGEKAQLQEKPAMRPVPRPTSQYRKAA